MLITIETWDIYDVDLPQIEHTFEEVLNELKEKYKDFSYIEKLITRLPQLKIILPYFYDYIFATNYKDAEKWFIKGLLYFPSSYEAEKVIFSLVDESGDLWIPCLLWKEEFYEWKWIIEYVCELISRIIIFLIRAERLEIRKVLEECYNESNTLEIWKKHFNFMSY